MLLTAGTAWSAIPDHAAGLVVGGGVLGSHLSDRTYLGLTYAFPLSADWLQDLAWGFKVHGEADLARWHGCTGADCGDVTDVGATSVFRTALSCSPDVDWYLDLAVGAHLISRTRIASQVYSTGFQFSEFMGTGLLFGEQRRYEVGARLMHESNGDWKTPNDGMDLLVLNMAVHW